MDKGKLKILIVVLAGLVLFQAVSIGIMWVKNARLKAAIAKKAKPAPARIAARAAIVLDDWGYNTRNISALFGLGEPITISVLPNLPFSKRIAQEAHSSGIEVVLHLPLEAHDSKKSPEKTTIYTYMKRKDVLVTLQKAFESVPNIKGVSNHMGSKATEDEKFMRLLFGQFKKKNLYFLDSLVTNNSVCQRVAADTGIRFAARSVFLDNNNDIEYIKGQLRQLLYAAKQRKTSIGIGHDRALTIRVIKEMLPEFQREGVKLVYVSELVE